MSTPFVENLTLEIFVPLVRTAFKVELNPEQAVPLELTTATEIETPGKAATFSQEGFSLIFTGPDGAFLPQGTYEFQHDRIGRFLMFLVPVGKKAGLIEYQVIFNRISRAG